MSPLHTGRSPGRAQHRLECDFWLETFTCLWSLCTRLPWAHCSANCSPPVSASLFSLHQFFFCDVLSSDPRYTNRSIQCSFLKAALKFPCSSLLMSSYDKDWCAWISEIIKCGWPMWPWSRLSWTKHFVSSSHSGSVKCHSVTAVWGFWVDLSSLPLSMVIMSLLLFLFNTPFILTFVLIILFCILFPIY